MKKSYKNNKSKISVHHEKEFELPDESNFVSDI